MNYPRIPYYLALLLVVTTTCVEPFTPEIDNYEDILVVDAAITDDPSTHFVKLTRTEPIYSQENDPGSLKPNFETGAEVIITDLQGNTFHSYEIQDGYYQFGFNPTITETYTLSITTRDGKTYNSSPVVMKQTPPIEDLYFERASVPSEESGSLEDGFQIYIDTGTGESESGYYKFEWEETWEVVPPYPSFYDYSPELGRIIIRENNISNCWVSSASTDLNIISTENLASDVVKAQPIRFIPFSVPILNVKYSILVKQQTLSQDAFYFWKNLEETSELTGTLYDKQPSQIIGNIRNINDPSEPVLGYFDMATVSSQRIFIDKFDLPQGVHVESLYAKSCRSGADTLVSERAVPELLNRGYLISYFIFMQGYVLAEKNCVDCRYKGSNVKPEFWE